MKIKLCGLMRPQDIEYANEFKPDYIGFVFAKSRRRISPETARDLKRALCSEIKVVGVFVNEEMDAVAETARMAGLDVIQLHGDENEEYIDRLKQKIDGLEIWKAVRVSEGKNITEANKLPADKLLFDALAGSAYGGTGCLSDLDMIGKMRRKIDKPFFLAGGLNQANVLQAIAQTGPFGIDVSTGIETDGCKDRDKIRSLTELIRGQAK